MTFTVLGITGSLYGLAAGVSALCYLGALILLYRKTYFNAEIILLYGILGMPLGLLVSRVFFCAVNYTYYVEAIQQPVKMLYFWDGGYSMAGLLLGLVAAAWLTAKLKKLNYRSFLDAVTLPMGVLLFGLRLAEGLSEYFGIGRQVEAGALAQSFPLLFVTETFGALELHRLAVFRYEAVFALLLLGFMLLFKRSKKRRDGDLTMLFFALQGAGQIFFESMRNDGHMIISFIRVQQVLALLSILIVLGVFCHRYGQTRGIRGSVKDGPTAVFLAGKHQKAYGARGAVTAAWTMLPIMALVLYMMITPINHMLDLTDKLPLGIGILAVMGAYLAFFLRIKGANFRLICTWLVALITVGACVMLEFSMDGSANLTRDYALLALCAAVLFLCPYSLYLSLSRQENLT